MSDTTQNDRPLWTITYPGHTATKVGDILGPNTFDEYLVVVDVAHVQRSGANITKVGVRIATDDDRWKWIRPQLEKWSLIARSGVGYLR